MLIHHHPQRRCPLPGRINDAGLGGLDEISALQEMNHRLHRSTRPRIASIHQVSDLTIMARQGSNIIREARTCFIAQFLDLSCSYNNEHFLYRVAHDLDRLIGALLSFQDIVGNSSCAHTMPQLIPC